MKRCGECTRKKTAISFLIRHNLVIILPSQWILQTLPHSWWDYDDDDGDSDNEYHYDNEDDDDDDNEDDSDGFKCIHERL